MILLWFQQALKAAINEQPLLSDIFNEVYTFIPIDKVPPYLYITSPGLEDGSSQQNVFYGDVAVHLVVRETGVVQTSHITHAIMEILEMPLTINVDGKNISFIFKPRQQTVVLLPNAVTRRLEYHGRLKMNKSNL